MAHVLQETENFVMSPCCFADDYQKMYQLLKRTCEVIFLLINPLIQEYFGCTGRFLFFVNTSFLCQVVDEGQISSWNTKGWWHMFTQKKNNSKKLVFYAFVYCIPVCGLRIVNKFQLNRETSRMFLKKLTSFTWLVQH